MCARCEAGSPGRGLSRRGFLGLAACAAVGLGARRVWGAPPGTRPAEPGRSVLEREHLPRVRMPAATINGAKVPIVVEMDHPMTADHYVERIAVVNASDPIPSKGTFHLTPGNGRVYLAFQARMHHGGSEVAVTAECNRHGAWTTTLPIEIPQGAGGCTGTAPSPGGRTRGEDIRAPVIRIPALVERGGIRRDEVILAQVKMRHPSRTGLVFRDGAFEQASEPLFLEELQVVYAGERVSRFELTPALSDDPFITFGLRAHREGVLEVALTNSRGQRFEASQEIRFT